MEPVRRVTGTVCPLPRADVDTDQIIPKQFLTRIERTGFAAGLFHGWRGTPGFPLDRPEHRDATILVTGPNFGCGSSREHAVWALAEHGFRAVVAPSLADIFQSNCFQVGVVPVVLEPAVVDQILERVAADPGWELTVDVERGEVRGSDGLRAPFPLAPFRRRCLLEGLDEIAITLESEDAIARHEAGASLNIPPTSVVAEGDSRP